MTVSSPPEISRVRPVPAWRSASAAWARPSSAASPCTSSPMRMTCQPSAFASASIRSSAVRPLAMTWTGWTGASSAGALRIAASSAGSICQPVLARIASARSGSNCAATVGPEAITSGRSPTTSETRKLCMSAAAAPAAAASRPPFTRERWRRTRLISSMAMPERTRCAPIAALVSSETPAIGSHSSDEPPPEMRKMTRSSLVALSASSRMRRPAARPAASGTGWRASITSMPPVDPFAPWP